MQLEQHRPRLTIPVSERDHSLGLSNAPLTLVEYGDYECPYCGRAYPIVKRLQAELGEKLRFVFRNFPLNTIHEHAGVAAQAAEAAASQGKFWEMHDLLYENQDELADADLNRYALKLGLEIYRFEAEMSGEVHARRVREDFRGGIRSGVNGTPTFFINGARYNGPLEYEALKKALQEELGRAPAGPVVPAS